MKFFIAFALIATVASATYTKPAVTAEAAEIQEIIAAIHSPSTNPATAAALEQMLFDILGVNPSPVVVGPAFIDADSEVILEAVADVIVGPAIVEPTPVSPVVPVLPTPVDAATITPTTPLVQIILNINQATTDSAAAVVPAPAIVDNIIAADPVIVVDSAPVSPVQVVDNAPVSPIQVVDNAPVSPVQVVDVAPVSPIQVVDTVPVAVEPVIIGTPVFPAPAVVLPDILN